MRSVTGVSKRTQSFNNPSKLPERHQLIASELFFLSYNHSGMTAFETICVIHGLRKMIQTATAVRILNALDLIRM